MGWFSGKSMVTSSAAGVLAAMLLSTTLVPSAHAVDGEDFSIQGPAFVGSGLSVKGAYEYFSACDPNAQPSYSVQWLRDGQPVYPEPNFSQFYDLDIEDVGSRISAVVTGSNACEPAQVVVPESDVVRSQPMRAEGFTGRGVFELLGRRHDGALLLYPGQDGAQGWTSPQLIGPNWGSYTRIIGGGDLTSDGKTELLTADGSGRLWMFWGRGDGTFPSNAYPSEIGWGWNAMDKVVGPGDFDGDGYNDLLATEPNGNLYLYPKAARGWTPRVHVGQGWNVMDLLITPGDFNGDGTVDILAKDKVGRLFLYGGNGRGGWLSPRLVGQGWNALSKIGSAGDFNRDGFNDVHGVNSAGELLMYYGDGRGGWKGVETVGWGWNIFNALY
ncbi:FG-GAP repeat domain-containing protein [Paenarthrobacter aurescens]|uniref:FG-GAP repeat domain-containing protein n=1 Tax=Paenarthrobacter aurescens TaxID=43663 RepID=UPI0002E3FCE4|nr:VCBS repeat-containing protein [Paenarthrobacter aurescens]